MEAHAVYLVVRLLVSSLARCSGYFCSSSCLLYFWLLEEEGDEITSRLLLLLLAAVAPCGRDRASAGHRASLAGQQEQEAVELEPEGEVESTLPWLVWVQQVPQELQLLVAGGTACTAMSGKRIISAVETVAASLSLVGEGCTGLLAALVAFEMVVVVVVPSQPRRCDRCEI